MVRHEPVQIAAVAGNLPLSSDHVTDAGLVGVQAR